MASPPSCSLPTSHLAGHPSICSQCPSFPRSQSHFLMVFASPAALPTHPPFSSRSFSQFPCPNTVVSISCGLVQHMETHLGPQGQRSFAKKRNLGHAQLWISTHSGLALIFFNFTELLLSLYPAQWQVLVQMQVLPVRWSSNTPSTPELFQLR